MESSDRHIVEGYCPYSGSATVDPHCPMPLLTLPALG